MRPKSLVATAMAAILLPLGLASAEAAASAATGPGQSSAGPVDRQNPVDAQRAVATYQAMQDNLYLPDTGFISRATRRSSSVTCGTS